MNIVRRFIKTAMTYFLGNVLSKIVSFLLLPLYTSYLRPDVYGEYDLVITILNLVVPIVFFQIWDGMFRFSFDENNGRKISFVINNGLFVSIFGSVLYVFVILISSMFYSPLGKWYVILYGLLLAYQYNYTVITRAYLNNTLFSVSGGINTFVTAIINIILIVKYNFGVSSLYIAADIGLFIQIFVIEYFVKSFFQFQFKDIDFKYIKQLIYFSLPLCFSTVLYWLLYGYTKMIISGKLGVYDNGLFAIANKFTSLVIFAVNIFQFAWNEMIYILSNNEGKNNLYEFGSRMLFKGTVLSSCIILFLTRLSFPFFVDSSYWETLYILPISIIGVLFNSYASFMGTIFLANKKSKKLLSTVIIAAIINMLLSPCITETFGLIGSVIVLSFSLGILAVSRIIILKKEYEIILDIETLSTLALLIFSIIVYYMQNKIIIDSIYTIFLFFATIAYMRKEFFLLKKYLIRIT